MLNKAALLLCAGHKTLRLLLDEENSQMTKIKKIAF